MYADDTCLTVQAVECVGGLYLGLCFLMYINYLKACSLSSYVRMYADDTYLTPCAIDPEMLKFELNHYLEIVHSWLYANKLSLKTKKTKIPYK